YSAIMRSHMLSLLSSEQIRSLITSGIDIGLHTHRHQLPEDDRIGVEREVFDNRQVLEPLVGKRLDHLCYPSGVWGEQQWPWLQQLGIRSAMTCEIGLNYADTPRLGLRRILDGENVSQIEFEAELFGYGEVLRRVRRWQRELSSRLWDLILPDRRVTPVQS